MNDNIIQTEDKNFDIMYQHYLDINIKYRNEAIECLEKRDFNTLYHNYIHWFNKKEKIVRLESSKISDVIVELSKVKYQNNESEPTLSICVIEKEGGVFGGDTESHIEICSYIYTIVDYDKCESLAKYYAKNSIWKLKHQPNGKDAESYRKTLEKYRKKYK